MLIVDLDLVTAAFVMDAWGLDQSLVGICLGLIREDECPINQQNPAAECHVQHVSKVCISFLEVDMPKKSSRLKKILPRWPALQEASQTRCGLLQR